MKTAPNHTAKPSATPARPARPAFFGADHDHAADAADPVQRSTQHTPRFFGGARANAPAIQAKESGDGTHAHDEQPEPQSGKVTDVQRTPAFGDGDDPTEAPAEQAVQRTPAFGTETGAADLVQRTAAPGHNAPGLAASRGPDAFFGAPAGGRPLGAGVAPFFQPQGLQAKLKVGAPDDRFEREADAVADRVARIPSSPPPQPQRDEGVDEEAQEAVASSPATQPLALQRKGDGSGPVSDDFESSLRQRRGQGRPLSADVRVQMEEAIGADFSGVRVHEGRAASRLSNEIGARAFTHGGDVYFNEGQHAPETTEGRRLLAHELMHTVQQGASVQRTPTGRTGGVRIQRGPFGSLVNRVLRHVPGWTLLTLVIGKNPVTGDTVPRTGENILDALIGLIPGGAVLADKLRTTGALAEAGNWLSSEIDKLGLTFDYIKSLVSKAWDELSIWNRWSTNLRIVKNLFATPYRRLTTFAGRVAGKIKEFVFRGALKLVGAPVQTIMGILNKGGDVLQRVVSDPIGFFRNLASAVGGGIRKFVGNIRQHLAGGLVEWLTGAMSSLPITLPSRFDVKGIFHLVLQILGLTWNRLRAKLVKRLGEKVVSAVEKGVEIVQRLRREGPMALWEMIKEKAAEIKQQVMEGIRNWVVTQVVKQAVIKVLSFLNPAGALVQAALGLYNLVMFLHENMSRIADFVRSVFGSIGEIARGAVGRAVEFIHGALGRTVSVMLSFLARLTGLGNVGKAVSKVIERIRKPVDRVVDKALDFIVRQAKKLFRKGKALATAAKEKLVEWWTTRVGFTTKGGGKHTLLLEKKGVKAEMYVASEKTLVEKALETRVKEDQTARTALTYYRDVIQPKEVELARADQTYRGIPTSEKKEKRAARYQVQKHTQELRTLMGTFATKLALVEFDGTPAGTIRTNVNKRPDKGRASFVEAKPLTHLPGDYVGSTPQEDPPGWELARDAGWKRGHLLSEHLHGPGLAWNLTPMSTSTNKQMEEVESKVRPLLSKQESVLYYRVAVSYDDSRQDPYDKYPTDIEMEWGYLKQMEGGATAGYQEQQQEFKPLRNLGEPDPSGVPNVNESGRPTLIRKGISPRLARDIPHLRDYYLPAHRFENYIDLVESLEEYYNNKYTHLETGERTTFTSVKRSNFRSGGRAELGQMIAKEKKLVVE